MSSAIRWCPVSLVSRAALLTTRTNAPKCGLGGGGVMIATSMEAPTPSPQIAATDPKQDSRLCHKLNCQLFAQLLLSPFHPMMRAVTTSKKKINALLGIPTWWVPVGERREASEI